MNSAEKLDYASHIGNDKNFEKQPATPNLGYSSERAQRAFKGDKYRDVWATILFVLHFAGSCVIFGLYAKYLYEAIKDNSAGIQLRQILAISVIGLIPLVVCSLLLLGFLSLAHKYPKNIIRGSFISSICLSFALGALTCIGAGGIIAGLPLFFIGIINLIMYFVWRSRIPFSATMLAHVIKVLDIYPSTWYLAPIAVCFEILAAVFFLSAIAAVLVKNNLSSGQQLPPLDLFFIIYLAFSLFWTTQVLQNVVHTAASGVYATFYFLHGSGQGVGRPVWSSLKRALTYSFGSIAFGSLIVALIQLVRYLLSMSQDGNRRSTANVIADCFLGIIESLVQYFNYYAYIHIAIYGSPYIESASKTWDLVRSRGIDAVINDDLVGVAMNMGTYCVGILTAAATFVIVALAAGDLGYGAAAALGSFILAIFMGSAATQLVKTGVSATFVCLAEEPSVLQRNNPELQRELAVHYSNITF